MMEAVGRRKAHWLFGAGSEKTFSGKRRPQEDMVTSAVFGSIRLMSEEDRRKALAILLGEKCWNEARFDPDADIDIALWPQDYRVGTSGPEPDVVLGTGGGKIIVEVKWHAPLSERQLEQQIEAVGSKNVSAVVMLGEAGVEERIFDTPCFRRTWRDVSGDLQNWKGHTNTPLKRWAAVMRDFLQQTDMGRIFDGLPPQIPVEPVKYAFSKPDHPPWLDIEPLVVGPVHYNFGDTL